MDNEQELAVIFKELSHDNQAYLLLEARRSSNAEKAVKDRGYAQQGQLSESGPPPGAVPALRT